MTKPIQKPKGKGKTKSKTGMSGTMNVTNSPIKQNDSGHEWRDFEPKLNNRFIVYMDGIPPYLIFKAYRPFVTTQEAKYVYSDLVLEVYDPIVPSTSQILTDFQRQGKTTFDKIEMHILGPIGDIVEQWSFHNCTLKTIQYSELDWSNSHPITITLRFSFENVIHEF